jgi:hypothetical protein
MVFHKLSGFTVPASLGEKLRGGDKHAATKMVIVTPYHNLNG